MNITVYFQDNELPAKTYHFENAPREGDYIYIGDNCYFRVDHVIHAVSDSSYEMRLYLGKAQADPSENQR